MIHQLSVTIVAGLLRTQTLRLSASCSCQLPFPTLFRVALIIVFLVTWSLFDYTICYPPCVRSVNTIWTCSFPFSPKMFVSPALFLLLLNFLNPPVWRSLQLLSKIQLLYLRVFPTTYNPLSKFPNHKLKCFLSLYEILGFFNLPKYFHLKIRLLSALVALLACSILYINYQLDALTIIYS